MQPRTLDQVLASLSSVYDPQVQSLQKQRDAIPGQVAEQEQGLQARQTQAFDNILGGARQRGLGFGGIPLAEQAKYTSTEYLPALANMRTSANNNQTQLSDAINQIYERRNQQAQSIFTDERNFYEQQRQFNEQMAFQKAQQAAAERAARESAAAASATPSLDDILKTLNQNPQTGGIDDKQKQSAANALVGLLKTKDLRLINQTFNAIKASAQKGNIYDQYKLEYLAGLQKNSSYGDLIRKAYGYKAPAPAAKKPSVSQQVGLKSGPGLVTQLQRAFTR